LARRLLAASPRGPRLGASPTGAATRLAASVRAAPGLRAARRGLGERVINNYHDYFLRRRPAASTREAVAAAAEGGAQAAADPDAPQLSGEGLRASLSAFLALERRLAAVASGAANANAAASAIARGETDGAPEAPRPEECCGKDCANCVWIVYASKLAAWEEAQRQQGRGASGQ
jgi:hypothetical protein